MLWDGKILAPESAELWVKKSWAQEVAFSNRQLQILNRGDHGCSKLRVQFAPKFPQIWDFWAQVLYFKGKHCFVYTGWPIVTCDVICLPC